jgi:hypothetical protein
MIDWEKYFEVDPLESYLIPMFSVPVMHLKLQDWDNKKEELYKIYNERAKNSNVFKRTGTAELDVDTDYHYNFDSEVDHQGNRDGYSSFLDNLLDDELKFVSEIFEFDVSVGNSWFEKASKHKFHSPHNHGAVGLSCVIYLQFDPKKHTPTVFLNPITATFGPNAPYAEMPPGINEGSMIVFPSYLMHYTAPNYSDLDRIILSFNLELNWQHEKFSEINKNALKGDHEYAQYDV